MVCSGVDRRAMLTSFAFAYAQSVVTNHTSIGMACVWCACAGVDGLTEGVAVRTHCRKDCMACAATKHTCGRRAAHALHHETLSLECLSSQAQRARLRQWHVALIATSCTLCHDPDPNARSTWSCGCCGATPLAAPLPPPGPPWQLQIPRSVLNSITPTCTRYLRDGQLQARLSSGLLKPSVSASSRSPKAHAAVHP